MSDYELKAQRFAERYGIVDYDVVRNTMVYYDNHRGKEYVGGVLKFVSYTMKRTVNLDTGDIVSIRLKRLNKRGWNNQ